MFEEWVSTRADQLERTFGGTRGALCTLISIHEEPPVDPLDRAIGEAFDMLPPEWTRDIFVASVGKTLRKHGIEIAKERS